MKDSSQFYKKFSLYLTDHISGNLKVGFNTMDMTITQSNYETFSKEIPSYFFAGIFKLKDITFLTICEAKIIYALSNRMLGGNGLVETRPEQLFTDSEIFFGELFMEWVLEFYKKHNKNIEFKKFETDKSQFQSFFPTDELEIASMSCTMQNSAIGNIYVCHKAGQVEK